MDGEIVELVGGGGKAGLKRDGAAVEISDGSGEVVPLASAGGKMGFDIVVEPAAFSAGAKGIWGTKADKEAANGLGEAAGMISFEAVPVGLGKAKGEVVAGAPVFSTVSVGLGKANREGTGGVLSLATAADALAVWIASPGFGKAKGEGEGEGVGLAANGFTGAVSAALLAWVPENMEEKGSGG